MITRPVRVAHTLGSLAVTMHAVFVLLATIGAQFCPEENEEDAKNETTHADPEKITLTRVRCINNNKHDP